MLLNEDQRMLRDTVRDFADRELAPYAAEWDKKHQFPKEAVEKISELGVMGVAIDEAYGGAGMDYVSLAIVIEEIARGDASTSTIVSVQNSLVAGSLQKFGTEHQKAEVLTQLTAGTQLGCFALTEPAAGSNAAAIETKAVKEGDEWVINGSKIFISNGKHADWALVFAVTGANEKGNEITCFLVDTKLPGYQVPRIEDKLGQRASDTAQLQFDNLRVPDSARLGEVGQGYKIAMSNLEAGRIGIAAQSVGIAQAALEAAEAYAADRRSFGRPIHDHQAIAFMLAEMGTQVEAARQMTLHAAALQDAGMPCLKEACMAKLFASQAAEKVCTQAIQVHGGYGYVTEFPVERYHRDVRVCTIYEGTSEIQKIVISRQMQRGL